MDFSTVFSSVMVMGSTIVVGILLSRAVNFGDDARQLLMTIIINVAMPCIILHSIFQFPMNDGVFKLVLITFIFSVVINLLGLIIGWLSAKLSGVSPQRAKEMAVLSGFGNTAVIGVPLCATLFGPKGALLAAVFDAGLDFTIWTAGVMLLQKNTAPSLRSLKAMINIPMAAVVVGLTMGYLQIQPPPLILTVTGNLAGLTSPLAMIYIGLLVPSLWAKLTAIPKLHLGVPIFVKLLVLPVVATLILSLLTPDKAIAQVVLVQASMPTITIASILFTKYQGDVELGAAGTVFATIISLITIPIMVYHCGNILSL